MAVKSKSSTSALEERVAASHGSSALLERFFNSRLRLSQLRLLSKIAELKQLRKVAESLSVTPAAVSKQVAEMETALQRPILRRVANSVELTDVGVLLARRSREMLDHLERTRVELDELCAGISGHVGIGAVPSVAPLLLPPLVMSLKKRAPNVSIRLEQGVFSRLAPMLDEGSLDLVLARETGHVPMVDFRQKEILEDPLAVVCGTQNALASKGAVTWKDIDGMPWLLPARGSPTFLQLEKLMTRQGMSFPLGSVESTSWQVNVALLELYPFVTLLPLAYARKFQVPGRITMLALSTERMQATIKAVWRKDNGNATIDMLLEFLRQQSLLL